MLSLFGVTVVLYSIKNTSKAVLDLSKAMLTHPDIGLFVMQDVVLQDVNRLVANLLYVFGASLKGSKSCLNSCKT